MKKRILLIVGLLATTSLVACDIEWKEDEIYYDDKLRPVSQVEEIIADKLEVENPELDIEVNIYEETED